MPALFDRFIPIVLCAGFGNRLRPLTRFFPKVVCPIIDKPFAFYNIEIFFRAGFESVFLNVHYLADEVQEELKRAATHFGYDSRRLVFFNEPEILETGGGIVRIFSELTKKYSQFKTRDLLVVSGDIISEFPLERMIERWLMREAHEQALMCSLDEGKMRSDATWISSDGQEVIGFGSVFFSEAQRCGGLSRVFSNHQIISGEFISQSQVEKKSSIDLIYREILKRKEKIIHLEFPKSAPWFNVGDVHEYLKCIDFFMEKNTVENIDGALVLNEVYHYPKTVSFYLEKMLKTSQSFSAPDHRCIVIKNRNQASYENKYIPILEDGSEATPNFYFYV